MTQRAIPARFALLAVGLLAGSTASAQFKLDQSPSGQRAAFAADTAGPLKPDLNKNRINPLSPLGGPQTGSPLYIQPAAPVTSVASASSVPSYDPPRPGIGASAALAETSSAEDPNKPRQPLRPPTLTKAATPKP